MNPDVLAAATRMLAGRRRYSSTDEQFHPNGPYAACGDTYTRCNRMRNLSWTIVVCFVYLILGCFCLCLANCAWRITSAVASVRCRYFTLVIHHSQTVSLVVNTPSSSLRFLKLKLAPISSPYRNACVRPLPTWAVLSSRRHSPTHVRS